MRRVGDEVDGLAMNSPQNARQLYSTLRSTSDFELALSIGLFRRRCSKRQ